MKFTLLIFAIFTVYCAFSKGIKLELGKNIELPVSNASQSISYELLIKPENQKIMKKYLIFSITSKNDPPPSFSIYTVFFLIYIGK